MGPVGGGPARTDLTQAVKAAGPAPKVSGATSVGGGEVAPAFDAAILSALSEPDLARLLMVLEPQPQNANQISELLQAVLTAAAAGDVERALAGVSQLAGLEPLRVEAMRSEQGLEPVRVQLDSLLARLGAIAKLDAQSRIAHATQLIDESRSTALQDWDADPHVLLTIANRLLEAGGYVNAVRASQVAQLVADGSRWAPALGTVSMARTREVSEPEESWLARGALVGALRESWRGLRGRAPQRVFRLWRRAPLLVLLVTWLAAGTAGGLILRIQQAVRPGLWPEWLTDAGFTIWAIGFLVLVLVGFYLRVRNVRL